MAERFKAAVLKTVERKLRGFESLSLRHIYNCEFRIADCIIRNPKFEIYNPQVKHGEVAERLKAAAC